MRSEALRPIITAPKCEIRAAHLLANN